MVRTVLPVMAGRGRPNSTVSPSTFLQARRKLAALSYGNIKKMFGSGNMVTVKRLNLVDSGADVGGLSESAAGLRKGRDDQKVAGVKNLPAWTWVIPRQFWFFSRFHGRFEINWL